MAARTRPTGRVRGFTARIPLRVRLVVAVLGLLVFALLASGVIGVTTMRSYLTGRVDSQLRAVAEHPGDDVPVQDVTGGGTTGGAGGGPGGGRGGRGGHQLASAFVVQVLGTTGAVTYQASDLIDATEPLPRLPTVTATTSTGNGSRTLTVGAISGNGQWRVLVEPVRLTDGTAGTLLVAQSLGDVTGTVDRLALILLVIGAATVVVMAALAYVIVRRSLRPLRAVEHTATAIAAGDLTQRVPTSDPRTEVGQLAAALNTMLGEIETAFDQRSRSEATARESETRMRRFVADASHELRTPLTSIRGFAELYRQGAVPSPVDVDRVMRRIEDEGQRMGLLVEDLLTLARLDQQRPLTRVPVDLLALATDAVHDARAIAPDRSVSLTLGATDPPPIVTGDEARLRQVVGNLVGNALRHTPPRSAVAIEVGATRSGDVELAVVDDGPGLSQSDAAQVFERFYRSDQARNRDDGGTGLGLSIVAALVAAHGGTVWVETAPGAGARFVVRLPLAV